MLGHALGTLVGRIATGLSFGGQSTAASIVGFTIGDEPIDSSLLLRDAMDDDLNPTAGGAYAQFLAQRERGRTIGEHYFLEDAARKLKDVEAGIRDKSPKGFRNIQETARELGRLLSNASPKSASEIVSALQVPTGKPTHYALVKRLGHFALIGSEDPGARLIHDGDEVYAKGLLLREEGRNRTSGDYFLSLNDSHPDPKTGWLHFTLEREFLQDRESLKTAQRAMENLAQRIGGKGFDRYKIFLQTEAALQRRLDPSKKSELTIWSLEHFHWQQLLAPAQLTPNPYIKPRLTEFYKKTYPDPTTIVEALMKTKRYEEIENPMNFAIVRLPDGSMEIRVELALSSRIYSKDHFAGREDRFIAGGLIFAGEEAGTYQFSFDEKNVDLETIGLMAVTLRDLGIDGVPLIGEQARVVGPALESPL